MLWLLIPRGSPAESLRPFLQPLAHLRLVEAEPAGERGPEEVSGAVRKALQQDRLRRPLGQGGKEGGQEHPASDLRPGGSRDLRPAPPCGGA